MDGSTHLPKNWQQFLWDSANKTELFAFLAKHIERLVTTKQLVSTNGFEVVCILPWLASTLQADTRMILHLADAVNEGFHKILLRTVDSDVVVLCVAAVAKMNVGELWVAFGTGKHTNFFPLSIGPTLVSDADIAVLASNL